MKEWILRRRSGGTWYVSQSFPKPKLEEIRLLEKSDIESMIKILKEAGYIVIKDLEPRK